MPVRPLSTWDRFEMDSFCEDGDNFYPNDIRNSYRHSTGRPRLFEAQRFEDERRRSFLRNNRLGFIRAAELENDCPPRSGRDDYPIYPDRPVLGRGSQYEHYERSDLTDQFDRLGVHDTPYSRAYNCDYERPPTRSRSINIYVPPIFSDPRHNEETYIRRNPDSSLAFVRSRRSSDRRGPTYSANRSQSFLDLVDGSEYHTSQRINVYGPAAHDRMDCSGGGFTSHVHNGRRERLS